MIDNIPTYFDIKLSNSSKIFESEEIIGLSPEEIQKGEELYTKLLESLKKGEQIDEGLFTAILGGTVGAIAGPAIGKALCKVLGINEEGILGKLLTSRLVTTAIGISLGK